MIDKRILKLELQETLDEIRIIESTIQDIKDNIMHKDQYRNLSVLIQDLKLTEIRINKLLEKYK